MTAAVGEKGHLAIKAGPARPKSFEWLVDFITGQKVPHVGAEANRQAVEHYLVEKKKAIA